MSVAFCYLHVVSHGLARVILPEPILDRSAAEYKFSKTTQAYITLSRSWGRELLDTDAANTWISHIGLQHWF